MLKKGQGVLLEVSEALRWKMRILLAMKGSEMLKAHFQILSTIAHNFVPPVISQGLNLITKFTSGVGEGGKRGHFLKYHLLSGKGHLTVTKGQIGGALSLQKNGQHSFLGGS